MSSFVEVGGRFLVAPSSFGGKKSRSLNKPVVPTPFPLAGGEGLIPAKEGPGPRNKDEKPLLVRVPGAVELNGRVENAELSNGLPPNADDGVENIVPGKERAGAGWGAGLDIAAAAEAEIGDSVGAPIGFGFGLLAWRPSGFGGGDRYVCESRSMGLNVE